MVLHQTIKEIHEQTSCLIKKSLCLFLLVYNAENRRTTMVIASCKAKRRR